MSEKIAGAQVVAIVVNYRTPDLTIGCVESLAKSRGVALHVVVVDNASGDKSAEHIRERFAADRSVTVLERASNDGYAGGNNAGVTVARELGASFAFVLNSDTTVDPDCVRRLLEEMNRDARIALATPRIFFEEPAGHLWFGGSRFSLWHGRPIHVGFRAPAAEGWSEPRDLAFASGCALLVRLDAFRGDLFDASLFSYAEDLDLSLRATHERWRIRYVPDATVRHLEGASHRRAGGQALRFYLTTRNLLRVNGRHARWYHWLTLAPMLAVDVVGRFAAVTLRDRDFPAFAAVFRGALHAVTGGRHPIEGSLLRE